MMNLKNKMTRLLLLTMLVTLTGCVDTGIDIDNSADIVSDTPDIIYSLVDVETLSEESFESYWNANYSLSAMTLSTMADEISCSWGNAGMNDLSSEPRQGYDNDPSAHYRYMTLTPWERNYIAIAKATEALAAIDNDKEGAFEAAGIDVGKIKTFNNLMLGLSHGQLALLFDQGLAIDQNSDLSTIEFVDHAELMAFAISKLELAIVEAAEMETPTYWIFGLYLNNEDLIKLAHSYIARFKTLVARTPEERAAVDWLSISDHAALGITSNFAPIRYSTGSPRWDEKWHPLQDFGQEAITWSRTDYRTLGSADESGGYEAWLALPLEERDIFSEYTTTDRRIQGAGGPTESGTDFQYIGTEGGPFPSSRGTYHYSTHTHQRYKAFAENGGYGPMYVFLTSELDLIRAEGMLRSGDLAGAAALINNTRVSRGQLPAALPTDGAGAANDKASHLNSDGLWAMLKHERHIELYATGVGIAYYDDRGWGDLVQYTPLHFPVPGSELELLHLFNYTFGGEGNNGSAPKFARHEEIRQPF